MFELFTESARQVVVLAQDEALIMKHDYVGTEHLLLGVAREGSGDAAEILAACELDVKRLRAAVVELVGAGTGPASGQIPFTPRAKGALERSSRAALARGDSRIGPLHLLAGIAAEPEGVAMQVIAELGAEERLREQLESALGAESVARAAEEGVYHAAHTSVGLATGGYIGAARPINPELWNALAVLCRAVETVALVAAGLIVAAALVAVAILDAQRGSQAAVEGGILTAAAWGPAWLLVVVAIARDRFELTEDGIAWQPVMPLAVAAIGLAVAGILVHATTLTVLLGGAASAVAFAAALYAGGAAMTPSRSGR